jgi:hypothetical protein
MIGQCYVRNGMANQAEENRTVYVLSNVAKDQLDYGPR